MANVTIGDSNLSQNHPRIISLISNNSEVYETTEGGLKMFAAIISEKGTEEFKNVSSPIEFKNEYGDLDLKKYGQSGYNVQRWLQSGGRAVVRRLMPDDAAFSHALLNVRSKTVGTSVIIQPLVSSIGRAYSKDILDLTLEAVRSEENFDGFVDNIICQIIPTGRGKAYNNIGFRIYPNRQYDNFLNFRLYNIEVIRFDESGSVEIIEGPFAVSFNRDALSPINDESIFIEDVLAKYSNTLSAKVNDESFLKICKEICPEAVNPYIVDPLFGETRVINGVKEKVSGKDVHHKLFQLQENEPKLDNLGNNILNIADSNNEYLVERIRIEDEAIRNEYNYEANKKIKDMTHFIKEIRDNGEVSLGDNLMSSIAEGVTALKKGAVDDIRTLIARAKIAGNDIAAFEETFNTYMRFELKTKIAQSKKASGDLMLDNFLTLYLSELNLIVNANLENKIAFVLSKVSDFNKILTDLELFQELAENNETTAPSMSALDTGVRDLEDVYLSDEEKASLLIDLLNSSITHNEGLGYHFNKVIEGAKGALNTEIANIGDTEYVDIESFDVAYQTKCGEGVSKSFEEAEIIFNQELNKQKVDRVLFNQLLDLRSPVRLRDGSDGIFDVDATGREAAIEKYLVNFFNGNIDELITSTKLVPFSFILDANYSEGVKNAIANLASNIRRDFIFIADCGLNANAEGDLGFRQRFNVTSNFVAIYGQNVIVYDEGKGKNIKVTTPYLMAGKLPELENTVGLHQPIAGNRRGRVSGYKSINYLPNEIQQEDLYNARINYIIGDNQKHMLGSQLTSDFKRTPLSDLNNVITMLNIKREAENIVENYQFEFADTEIMNSMKQQLDMALSNYVLRGAADNVSTSVYASEYDKLQHIVRVNISLKFRDIIETVIITLEVTR